MNPRQENNTETSKDPNQSRGSETAPSFVTNVALLRERARAHIENGAVTAEYALDRSLAVKVLNEALATELVCVLRYKRHYFMASGIHSKMVADEFLEHAAEEQEHADEIAARIVQLGGAPDMDPSVLSGRAHSEYVEGDDLISMIREDLVAERIAIDSYREMIGFFAKGDPTTRAMLERILAKEEEHAEDLATLLHEIGH
jgi:bacterioferritin